MQCEGLVFGATLWPAQVLMLLSRLKADKGFQAQQNQSLLDVGL